jgi:hypothetical protein
MSEPLPISLFEFNPYHITGPYLGSIKLPIQALPDRDVFRIEIERRHTAFFLCTDPLPADQGERTGRKIHGPNLTISFQEIR